MSDPIPNHAAKIREALRVRFPPARIQEQIENLPPEAQERLRAEFGEKPVRRTLRITVGGKVDYRGTTFK